MEERIQVLREKIAQRISRHGMTIPALMFLEMHKPLAGVGGALIHMLAPGLDWILGEEDTDCLAILLSDRDQVDCLMTRLEELDTKKCKEVKNQC
ncbi:MAG: hypothetical protein PHW26_06255 [Eubacteriales bacterium]|nr:hypothetical protein [Eubacteriales bacterium]